MTSRKQSSLPAIDLSVAASHKRARATFVPESNAKSGHATAGVARFKENRGRCVETGFLEFHHVVPYADGGEASVNNVELRCRSHNQYEAERWFGPTLPRLARETRVVFGA